MLNREQLLTDSQKDYSISIYRAGEHLLKLINDILELSKIEAGRAVLKSVNFNLHDLLHDMTLMFKEQAQSNFLQLNIDIPHDLPRYIVADDQKLRRILINLIGNAIKFTTKGSVAVRTRIEKINDQANHLILEVEDTGTGITDRELKKLFKKFEQTSAGIKNNEGTGLGLALSRELAMLMGGDISVRSEEGKGSVFTVVVAIKEGSNEQKETNFKKRVISIDGPQNSYRVLVVDDKAENRIVVGSILRRVGFETNDAVDGADAISKFERWHPHLILMDIRMPVMDGYEAIRRIKSTDEGRRTPIVVVTANSFEDEEKQTMGLDIQSYVRKPFHEADFFETVGKALGIKYTYEGETTAEVIAKYLSHDGIVEQDILKLPDELVQHMKDAAEGADFVLLKELIGRIDTKNASLAGHLLSKANDFDYYYFQKALNPGNSNENPD